MKITPDMILKLKNLGDAALLVNNALEAKVQEIRQQQSKVNATLQEDFELALPDNTMSILTELLEANYDYFDFDETWLYPFGFIARGYDNSTEQKDSLRISFEEFNAFVEKRNAS